MPVIWILLYVRMKSVSRGTPCIAGVCVCPAYKTCHRLFRLAARLNHTNRCRVSLRVKAMPLPRVIPALADLTQDIAGPLPVKLLQNWATGEREASGAP